MTEKTMKTIEKHITRMVFSGIVIILEIPGN
jgi:hypothetical protein